MTPIKDNLKVIPNLSIGTTMYKGSYHKKPLNTPDDYLYKKKNEDHYPRHTHTQNNTQYHETFNQ